MSEIVIGVKAPGKQVEGLNTTGDLKELQSIVGGWLECIPFEKGMWLWCNEEGKLIGLESNFWYYGDVIVGTVFFSRSDGEGGMASLTKEDIKYLQNLLGEYVI